MSPPTQKSDKPDYQPFVADVPLPDELRSDIGANVDFEHMESEKAWPETMRGQKAPEIETEADKPTVIERD